MRQAVTPCAVGNISQTPWKSELRHDECPARPRRRRCRLLICQIERRSTMDIVDWMILKLVVLFIAALIYGFWRGWKGL